MIVCRNRLPSPEVSNVQIIWPYWHQEVILNIDYKVIWGRNRDGEAKLHEGGGQSPNHEFLPSFVFYNQ